jgi:membrane-associated phospholipid phosphatase
VGSPLTALRSASLSRPGTHVRITWRGFLFALLTVAYVLLTITVLLPSSPVLRFDSYLVNLHMWSHHPGWHPWLHTYVMFGQRGPSTLIFLPLFLWLTWRRRSSEPLVLLVTGLVLLNVSVGVVKYATGRVGPLHSDDVHAIFAGGNIYPSGHVSNTVVLYGLIAMLASRHRKALIAFAAVLSISVGLSTVYLRTHWFSDVVGGWIAGALVLLALPWVMPTAQRWADRLIAAAHQRWASRRKTSTAPAATAARPARPAGLASAPASAPGVRRPAAPQASPVSSAACTPSRRATSASVDALDDPTRCR